MNTKAIIQKQKELISRHKSFVKWMLKYTPEILESERGRNFIAECEDVESELSLLQEQEEDIEETVSKEGLPIYDSEESGDELKSLMTHDKETIAKWYLDLVNRRGKELREELRDELIVFCCACNIPLPRDKDYIDLVDEYLSNLKSNQ